MKLTYFLAATLLVTFTGPVHASFQEGEASYERGDYAAAVREFRPLAEQGNAAAQASLARMYRLGQGVAKDEAEAVQWIRNAADQGDANAQKTLAPCTRRARV